MAKDPADEILTPELEREIVYEAMKDTAIEHLERRFRYAKGYSLKAEMFAGFLVAKAPNGRGVFSFETNSGLTGFDFMKLGGMVTSEDKPLNLYQSIDGALQDGREHRLVFISMPLNDDGAVDPQTAVIVSYVIKNGDISPISEGERMAIIDAFPEFSDRMVPAYPWEYDLTSEYLKMEES